MKKDNIIKLLDKYLVDGIEYDFVYSDVMITIQKWK